MAGNGRFYKIYLKTCSLVSLDSSCCILDHYTSLMNFGDGLGQKIKILAKAFFSHFFLKIKCLVIWYSDPINNLSLKTPKSTFLTKFYKIGHFRPNSWTFNFELFFSKKNILHKKMADLANLVGRLADVADVIRTG